MSVPQLSLYDEKKVLDMIERVTKSVVNISTVRLVHNMFFQTVPISGMGSGTIIDAEKGLILTNNHVVGGAQKIGVTLWNSQVIEGTIVGSCVARDIAVVKVDGKDLQFAELGDSDKLRVGQAVYAIGNPFGLSGGPTVTTGVVSALNRTIQSDQGLIENLVQTDAAINPGNSGGPLVDLEGRIVAISTAIIPFAQGIGFAIPVNAAKSCAIDILTVGGPRKPWLGVIGITLTEEIAQYYGLPIGRGVLVTKIAEGSPAEQAQMRQGDIILEIDNAETASIDELIREIRKHKIDDKVRIFVIRESKQHFFEVTLGNMP
ncbi:MAG TPA: trypsin-like peptidase domain-containing protein [Candidatus Nanoarchaeia archaeon]|nr:trypsin-like peptidase domain-containing protein [Candidatus Nanoarchaeia archaeon]